MLAERIEPLCQTVLSKGRRKAGRWRVSGFENEVGESLSVALTGSMRGHFKDHATDESGDALDLVAGAKGCNIREALDWSRRWLGVAAVPLTKEQWEARENAFWSGAGPTPSANSARATTDSADERDAARLKRDLAWAARYVREMIPIAEAPAPMAYLEDFRKMTGAAGRLADVLGLKDAIGWHPSVYLNEPGEPDRGIAPHPLHGQNLGAIIGVMTDAVTAKPTGAVSRTYLGPGGLKVAKAKTLGSPGGIIRLSPDDEVLGGLFIAEGIESALRAMWNGFRPCWATGTTSLMRSFPALAGIEFLTIIVDNDKKTHAGLEAAKECEARWLAAGAEVKMRMSDEPGEDIDDAFRRILKLENDPDAIPKKEGSP